MDFKAWKRRVNAVIRRVCGFDADDLTDYAYREAWDRGKSPMRVAYDVLSENGYLR